MGVSGPRASAARNERIGGAPPAVVQRCIDQVGIGFAFAPTFHAATRHAAAPRRELGTRTLFNLLGPMTNPAQVAQQVIGVYDPRWCTPVARALWSKDDAPADKNDGGNERRVIKSRAGSRLIFDDDKQQLIIEDGGGKGRVTLDADKNLITIEALDGDVAVQAPAGELTLVADKAVFKAGGTLSITSGDGMTIAGDAGVTIKAGSAMAISGSTVDINNGGAKSAQAPTASPADVADPYGNG